MRLLSQQCYSNGEMTAKYSREEGKKEVRSESVFPIAKEEYIP
jgi:hypothetical protein